MEVFSGELSELSWKYMACWLYLVLNAEIKILQAVFKAEIHNANYYISPSA